MTRELLGELEHRVLLSVLRLEGDAYSAPVVLDLEACTGRDVAAAAVHIALRRLEEKGLVASELRKAPVAEGGRQRRCYTVTELGIERLQQSRRELLSLWRGIAPLLDTP